MRFSRISINIDRKFHSFMIAPDHITNGNPSEIGENMFGHLSLQDDYHPNQIKKKYSYKADKKVSKLTDNQSKNSRLKRWTERSMLH